MLALVAQRSFFWRVVCERNTGRHHRLGAYSGDPGAAFGISLGPEPDDWLRVRRSIDMSWGDWRCVPRCHAQEISTTLAQASRKRVPSLPGAEDGRRIGLNRVNVVLVQVAIETGRLRDRTSQSKRTPWSVSSIGPSL